tara:strand:+ start:4517 stop:5230 length:714 start_codon:yes stop_codon:yes gene_type:complete
MPFIKLYNFTPKIGEYINFIFTEHKDDYLCCNLTDYDLDCIMTFQCLTSKKKIKSLKSLAPLNKEMIGIIENIDDDNIELNLININKNSDDYNNFIQLNQNNHVLKKYINQFTHKYNKDLDIILENYIYSLNNNSNSSYLNQIVESNIDNDFYKFVKNNFKSNEIKSNELKLNIKCYGDINNVIKLFDETLEQLSISDLNIIQSKLSEYIVSSNHNLDEFTIILKNNILKYNDIILS